MPLYAYVCSCEHEVEKIRSYGQRMDPVYCTACGRAMEYRISAHHAEVDGIYSYAPNLGSAAKFERHNQAISEGKRVIDGVRD